MSRLFRQISSTLAAVALTGSTQIASGDPSDYPPDFGLGVGYANVSIGGSDSELNSLNALRFDGQYALSPIGDLPQLRIAGAFGLAMVFDNTQFLFVSDGGATFVGGTDIPLFIFEPEARIAWRQFLNDDGSLFLEPGVGVGWALANLSIDGEDSDLGQNFSESDNTFYGRAFANLGFWVTGGIAGVQVSYMRGGELDFAENARGDLQEFYIGVFGALQL